MGRWSQYDEDDYRLPEGMKRVGYDADTQVYTYQDANGNYWEGAEGARYGALRQVRTNDRSAYLCGPSSIESPEHTVQTDKAFIHTLNSPGELSASDRAKDWRYLAPFLLLVGLSLLLLFRLVTAGSAPELHTLCGGYEASSRIGDRVAQNHSVAAYSVRKGETCWAIAQKHDMSVDDLVTLNKGVKCEVLEVGKMICIWERQG